MQNDRIEMQFYTARMLILGVPVELSFDFIEIGCLEAFSCLNSRNLASFRASKP